MTFTDLSNAIKKLWGEISFHKHFNRKIYVNCRQGYFSFLDIDPKIKPVIVDDVMLGK